jgi:hypothetical protein
MKTSAVIRAWRKILKGERPSLSIDPAFDVSVSSGEIDREVRRRLHAGEPRSRGNARCIAPGCYAYDDAHLGGGITLRGLRDRQGQELIDGVLEVVDRLKPLHLSIVGGDPLVRYRELELMVPLLLDRGIHVQIVAFRRLPAAWAKLVNMKVVVSIAAGRQPPYPLRVVALVRSPHEHLARPQGTNGEPPPSLATHPQKQQQHQESLVVYTEDWTDPRGRAHL